MEKIEDKLAFQNNPDVMNKLGEEKIYFSDKIMKKQMGLFPKIGERILVITDIALYNFKDLEIKRRIKLEDLKAITISTTSNEFIIHCNQNEYDYLYIYPDRKKIIKVLQFVYSTVTNRDLLFCKKNEKDLSKFVVGKKERTKNPYLFKIKQNELTSIKDYIASGNAPTDFKTLSGKGKGEESLSLIFSSADQNIKDFTIFCEKKDVFNTIVNELYKKYSKYKEIDCYFICNGKKIKDYQTIEENGIKDGDHIILFEFESDD